MGRGLGTYGREDKCIQGFGGEILGETTSKTSAYWEDNIKMLNIT